MNRKALVGLLVVLASFALVGCSNDGAEGFGSLSVHIGGSASKTIAPLVEDVTVVNHRIHGVLDSNTYFDVDFSGDSCIVENLVAGSWTVYASGFNAKGIEVARSGEKTVEIIQNRDSSASFALEYFSEGRGSVSLKIAVPSADSNVVRMDATFTPITEGLTQKSVSVSRNAAEVEDGRRIFVISSYMDVGRYLVRFVMYDSNGKQVGFALDETLYVYRDQRSSFEWEWDKDYVPPVSAPTFDLESGTYLDGKVVHMTTQEPGATIYYTIDGSTPDSSSNVYSSDKGVVLDRNMTLKAMAIKEGLVDSSVTAVQYKVQVNAPSIGLKSGTYGTDQETEITCSTSDAQIYYTIDGTSPIESSTRIPYSQRIAVDRNVSINAYAKKDGLEPSKVMSEAYVFQCAAPVFNLDSGEFRNAQVVTISTSTVGGGIFYTTDGSDPSLTSSKYEGPSLSMDGTSKVRAFVARDGWNPSIVVEREYSFVCADPVLSVGSGSYESVQSVTIATETKDAVIHYTMDGTAATKESPVYVSGTVLDVSLDMHVSTIAVKDGYRPSNLVEADYYISPQQTGIVVKDPAETDFRFGMPQGWFSGMYLYSGIEKATLFVDTTSSYSNVRWFYDGYEVESLRGMDSVTIGAADTDLSLELGGHVVSLRVMINGVSYTENLYYVVVDSEKDSRYVFWGDLHVGGIGPGGGYIFYDVDADNNSGNADGLTSRNSDWRYMEVSKFDLGRLDGVPSISGSASRNGDGFIFGYYRTSSIGENSYVNGSSPTSTAFGTGKENTSSIVGGMGDGNGYLSSSGGSPIKDYAANLCRTMVSHECDGAISDWYLPSLDEMKTAISFLSENGIETLSNIYLTSSEASALTVRTMDGSLAEGVGDKSQSYCVRPMRRF